MSDPTPPVLLLVDDKVKMVDLFAQFLRYQGLAVVKAYDGVEGVEAIARQRPDWILTGWNMPHAKGDAVLRAAQAADPPVPTVVLTAAQGQGIRALAAELGARAFLEKPATLEDLMAAFSAIAAEDGLPFPAYRPYVRTAD